MSEKECLEREREKKNKIKLREVKKKKKKKGDRKGDDFVAQKS